MVVFRQAEWEPRYLDVDGARLGTAGAVLRRDATSIPAGTAVSRALLRHKGIGDAPGFAEIDSGPRLFRFVTYREATQPSQQRQTVWWWPYLSQMRRSWTPLL
jgi:hypothetical protein